MDFRRLKERVTNMDPLVIDLLIAVGLTVGVCVQIWLLESMRPAFVRFPGPPQPINRSVLPYVTAALVFMPLALRRTLPWVALLASGAAAAFYTASAFPPALTLLGPMIALYSVAAYSSGRRTTLLVLVLAGLAFALPAFVFSNVARVVEVTGMFVMLSAAAFLGDTTRSRRAYIAEVEQRALEAERTREEEALRRVDEERIRIAREVHDIVAHSLSIVAVQASAAGTLLESDPQRARESIDNIRTTSKQALAELRSMLDVLRTGEGQLPLAPATDLGQLEQLVRPIRDAGFSVEIELANIDVHSVPAFASVSAYRIVQEALTNAVRHSGGDRVVISVNGNADRLTVEVVDNGTATPGAEPGSTAGHGLRGMRERAVALGGEFEAGPLREGGFRVFAAIPLSRSSS